MRPSGLLGGSCHRSGEHLGEVAERFGLRELADLLVTLAMRRESCRAGAPIPNLVDTCPVLRPLFAPTVSRVPLV